MPVRFDAAADRLLRTTDLLNYNAAYTWMAWVYLVSDLNAASTFWIINDDTANNLDQLRTGVDGTTLNTTVRIGGAGADGVGTSLSLATWYHLTFVRESATLLRTYLNGVSDSTSATDVTGRTAATRLEHGARGSTNAARSDSRVDRIKAWSTNLTQAEIQAEMHAIRPQRTVNLYGFWPTFTGADRVTDYSGNGRAWTEVGTLTDEESAPVSWGAQSTQLTLPQAAAAGTTFMRHPGMTGGMAAMVGGTRA